MNTRLRWVVSGVLVGGLAVGSGIGAGALASRALADSPTPTVTATATATQATAETVTETATPTPGSTQGSATPSATPTAAPHGKATGTPTSARATPTPTRIRPKKFVANPTPIAARIKSITLPPPVVVEVGGKREGTGFSASKAVQLANKYAPLLQLSAPSYVPKNWVLQLIHVDPSQGLGFPPDGYFQYVPKGLKKAGGTYPSFYVTKQIGAAPVIIPGSKIKSVVITNGLHGAGQVTGTIADLKLKNGYEIVHITWSRLTVSYDVSSTVGVSKLSVKDLLAVAATVS